MPSTYLVSGALLVDLGSYLMRNANGSDIDSDFRMASVLECWPRPTSITRTGGISRLNVH